MLEGRSRPVKMKEWGDLTVMDPDVGSAPSVKYSKMLAAAKDALSIDAGNSLENPRVILYTGEDPGAEEGWDEVEEITLASTTGFLALCDSGTAPVRKENLATAGPGTYLVRVHASNRASETKHPRFLIQIIPGPRTGNEPAPEAVRIGDEDGAILVRTCFTNLEGWNRLLAGFEEAAEREANQPDHTSEDFDETAEGFGLITVIDNLAYTGFTPEQITALIPTDDENWPETTIVLIADEQALASAELPLLAVNNAPDDEDEPFRIVFGQAGLFVCNMDLGNTFFREWSAGVDDDGVYRSTD
ncbi:hypothetical protein AB0O76_43425 [Streptomyces sp. NPDC086554]|uniref:DUF6924 domain-containing protein n=1 Tax=Streptomyces sp. NPDC086554 TaxID=3154864 RepID=UPI00342B0509